MNNAIFTKQYMNKGKLFCVGDWARGKIFGSEHKNKLKEKARSRKKIQCPICGKYVIKQMYVRWHENKCKG